MYRAIVRFADLKDGGHIYEAGEQYPRPGFVVSDERLAELAGSDNRMGYPLIKAVNAPKSAEETEAVKQPAPKPKRARKPAAGRAKG